MVHSLVSRLRALLRGKNWIPEGADVSHEDWGGPLSYGPVSLSRPKRPPGRRNLDLAERCEPDPEWQELLAWGRAERAPTNLPPTLPPPAALARAQRAQPAPPAPSQVEQGRHPVAEEDEEWEWEIARAKAQAAAAPALRPRPSPPSATQPVARPKPTKRATEASPQAEDAAEWARLMEQAKRRASGIAKRPPPRGPSTPSGSPRACRGSLD